MNGIPAIASWSGGKDSCLALYNSLRRGYDVKYLVNFISREYKRCCFHGIASDLIKLQASSIGIPLKQHEVTADMAEYENEFKTAVKGIEGAEAMVFGDIYLDEHKVWVERVCSEIGIRAVEPLWNRKTTELLDEFIGLGFRTVVVSCQAEKLGKEFLGREVDRKFIREMEERNICPCGENGEFHTLVIDGPIFKRPIEILETGTVLKDGFWKHWFLDIKKYN